MLNYHARHPTPLPRSILFCYSRDRAVPFSGLWQKVDKRTRTPQAALWVSARARALLVASGVCLSPACVRARRPRAALWVSAAALTGGLSGAFAWRGGAIVWLSRVLWLCAAAALLQTTCILPTHPAAARRACACWPCAWASPC